MKDNNEIITNNCGGNSGCTLDEYILPYCIIDKYIFSSDKSFFRNDNGRGYDIKKVQITVDISLEKVEKEERLVEKKAA